MLLIEAAEADYPSLAALANLAYRGTGANAGWNAEEGLMAGERTNVALLQEQVANHPDGHLLTFRDDPKGELLGMVWLNPLGEGVWYLGLLAVLPTIQNRQLGRSLLWASEDFVRQHGGKGIRMTVIQLRDTLIAWYERRGYTQTGETEPFPYGDERAGLPLRDDLYFVVLTKDLTA